VNVNKFLKFGQFWMDVGYYLSGKICRFIIGQEPTLQHLINPMKSYGDLAMALVEILQLKFSYMRHMQLQTCLIA